MTDTEEIVKFIMASTAMIMPIILGNLLLADVCVIAIVRYLTLDISSSNYSYACYN